MTKFRVWDRQQKRWVSTNILLDYSGLLVWVFAGHYELIDDPERYDVQFCIDSPDKNGKEIYKRDIVKQENIYNGDIYVGEVKRDKAGRWYLGLDNYVPSVTELAEIIGNALENPELLEESK